MSAEDALHGLCEKAEADRDQALRQGETSAGAWVDAADIRAALLDAAPVADREALATILMDHKVPWSVDGEDFNIELSGMFPWDVLLDIADALLAGTNTAEPTCEHGIALSDLCKWVDDRVNTAEPDECICDPERQCLGVPPEIANDGNGTSDCKACLVLEPDRNCLAYDDLAPGRAALAADEGGSE